MPEIIPNHVPSPRTLLAWDGTAYRPVSIDAAGNLQIDVLGNANLDNALQSVATDRLIVRGEDQLYSYAGALHVQSNGAISGAGGFFDSPACAAGQIWKVTSSCVRDQTTPTTAIQMAMRAGGVNYRFHRVVLALAANTFLTMQCEKWMDPADVIRVDFIGGLAGDTCDITLTGHIMTLEV